MKSFSWSVVARRWCVYIDKWKTESCSGFFYLDVSESIHMSSSQSRVQRKFMERIFEQPYLELRAVTCSRQSSWTWSSPQLHMMRLLPLQCLTQSSKMQPSMQGIWSKSTWFLSENINLQNISEDNERAKKKDGECCESCCIVKTALITVCLTFWVGESTLKLTRSQEDTVMES